MILPKLVPSKFKTGDTIGVVAPSSPIIGDNIDELNKAISKYAQIDSASLSEISHGSAWKNTYADTPMSFADILKEIGADEDYIEYINSNFATQKVILNGVSASC